MRVNAGKLLLVVLTWVLLSSAALAQGTTATLNGSVSDPTGAAIPGAQIQVQNIDTNLTQTTQSSDSGLYSIGELPPGRYTLTTQKAGFQKTVQSGIVLTVNQVATLNISLQVGDVQQVVSVTANAELINTTTADLSAIINQSSVEELPLNGRDPSSLVLLTTGTTNVLNSHAGTLQTSNAFPDEMGASAGGGRQGSTYYLLDGAPNFDAFMGLAAPSPNADATQEFRVITNNYDVQYGYSPVAVVSIQTRTGGNAIHGGAFEFVRNNDLNAANFFSHKVDTLKRNQFGGFVGGPIRKDKLFYFLNYQATRAVTAATNNVTYTPTAAMLNGDFSAVAATLSAPFATVNGVRNQVNPSLFAPAAVTISKTALPLGQTPSSGQVSYLAPSETANYDEGTGRIDWTISNKQRMYVRNFTQYYNQIGGNVKGNLIALVDNSPGQYYNGVLGHNWMITNSTVNNLVLYYSQMNIKAAQEALDTSGQPVCWSRYINVTELPGQCYLEAFAVSGGFSSNWDEPTGERRSTWGLGEQVIKTIGNHTISAGMDLRKQFAQENTQNPTQPEVTFGGQYTGFGLADFLLGDMSAYAQGAGEIASVKGWQLGLYGQDQFRVRPSVTVTAGLRWDPNTPPNSSGGRGAAFRPGQQSTMFPGAPLGMVFPGDKGIDNSVTPTTYGYLQPRIGVSWQPSWLSHTVVRAGFGLYTGPISYHNYSHISDTPPFSPFYQLNGGPGTPLSLQNPWATFAGGNPFPPNGPIPWATISYKPPSDYKFLLPVTMPANFASNYHASTTQIWSFSIEQQLRPNLALHLAYVGSQTYHLNLVVDQNPGLLVPIPGTNPVQYTDVRVKYAPEGLGQIPMLVSAGTSPYHSLQVSIDKRMSYGFELRSNFTWSKVIDDAAEGDVSTGGTYPGVGNPYDIRANRGISDLNVPLISTTSFVYTSPVLRGHNAFVRGVLGSWELTSIYTLQSGYPFGIGGGNGDNNSGFYQYHDWANRVPGVSPNVGKGPRSQWLHQYINPAAFTQNPVGTFGNVQRNSFTGPKTNTDDAGIIKNWKIEERYNVQFRWEMFNAFNHTSFKVPTNAGVSSQYIDITTPNFGQITSVGPIPPRVMQGALKFTF